VCGVCCVWCVGWGGGGRACHWAGSVSDYPTSMKLCADIRLCESD